MEKLYTVSKDKTGTDRGSDHELLIAKFRVNLKKVGKTTKPFRYESESESSSVMSNSLPPYRPYGESMEFSRPEYWSG